MIRLATRAAEQLARTSDKNVIRAEYLRETSSIHGDFHTIMRYCIDAGAAYTERARRWGCRERVATTGALSISDGCRVLDPVLFSAESHGETSLDVNSAMRCWKCTAGSVRSVRRRSEYISLKLIYPEKFWGKLQMPTTNPIKRGFRRKVEKLETAIRQTEEKCGFVEQIFAFHL